VSRIYRKKLAVIIPAHNEGLVLATTIQSAVRAGMKKRDIFVVDDNSSDNTAQIARQHLGSQNVLSVRRSGKAVAVQKAITKFKIASRYTWLHVADADSIFGQSYFATFRRALDPRRYVAATGYVQSLKGGIISRFRVFEYVWGFSVVRRMQSWMKLITVIPGPTSCLRTDILKELNFDSGSLTEDFDITLQIHRKQLGQIQFIPRAKTYTQDPQNYSDYVQQISRWYRGFFQGVAAHKVGVRGKSIDWYILSLLLQNAYYGLTVFVLVPLLAVALNRPYLISLYFLGEILSDLAIAIFAASVAKRRDIIAAFPFFPILRLTGIFIFYKAFFEVILFEKFQEQTVGWETEGRRYELPADVVTN
jgi:biofilm PGA synthesis N-glycosyltransferase PgaC